MSAVNDLTGQESRASVSVTVTNDLGLKRNYNQIAYSGVGDSSFYRIYKSENGAAFGFIGETTALTFRDDNINADLSDAPIVGWNPFDGPGNYPSSVSFFEQRLFLGKTKNAPNAIYGSRSSDFENMDKARPLKADDSLAIACSSGKVNAINQLIPAQNLLALTSEAKDKAKPRDLVYTPERVAALLEAAAGREDRAHLFLYIMIALSTCGRSEAILELDAAQIRDGRIFFLADDRQQTKKRRSVVPIAPTLAPWLDGLKGKVIVSRKPKAERNWADPDVPEFFEYPCYDVGRSFESCLIEAGICTEVYDKDGEQRFHPIRHKLGETAPRPVLKGMGTPNTLRHTIITEMHRRGVPEAQIDAAAGHVGDGTGKRNYRHLRPDYLGELIEGVEAYWAEIGRYTTVHMRSQSGPKIINLSSARASARIKGK